MKISFSDKNTIREYLKENSPVDIFDDMKSLKTTNARVYFAKYTSRDKWKLMFINTDSTLFSTTTEALKEIQKEMKNKVEVKSEDIVDDFI